MQLATAYATSHMLFGCVVWGHAFGTQLRLRGASCSVGKLDVLYKHALRWALRAPHDMRDAALYLLAGTIPLHGLVIK